MEEEKVLAEMETVGGGDGDGGGATNGGKRIRSICVFCGSSAGKSPEYLEQAAVLGREMAARGISLVYGGGGVGLMGQVSRAVHEAGGQVLGIIPEALQHKEKSDTAVGEQIIVQGMHERKGMMLEKADAFIALPGGLGTLEEMVEATTWLLLGIHNKPVGLLNTAGYYERLLDFLSHAADEGFIKSENRGIPLSSKDPLELLDMLASFTPPAGALAVQSGARQGEKNAPS